MEMERRNMGNVDEYLDALTDFAISNSSAEADSEERTKDIPFILDLYLERVARNGMTLFPWKLVKPLIVAKLRGVMDKLTSSPPDTKNEKNVNTEQDCISFAEHGERILRTIDKYDGIPFTIQRLCELLLNPTKHYTRRDKVLRSLEKVVTVVSSVDPFGQRVLPGRKRYQRTMVDKSSEKGQTGKKNTSSSSSHLSLPISGSLASSSSPPGGQVDGITPSTSPSPQVSIAPDVDESLSVFMDGEYPHCPSPISPLPPSPSSSSPDVSMEAGAESPQKNSKETASLEGKTSHTQLVTYTQEGSDDEGEEMGCDANQMTSATKADSNRNMRPDEVDGHCKASPNGSSEDTMNGSSTVTAALDVSLPKAPAPVTQLISETAISSDNHPASTTSSQAASSPAVSSPVSTRPSVIVRAVSTAALSSSTPEDPVSGAVLPEKCVSSASASLSETLSDTTASATNVTETSVSPQDVLDSSASSLKSETSESLLTSTSKRGPKTSETSLPQTSEPLSVPVTSATTTKNKKSTSSTDDSSTDDKIVSSATESASGEDKHEEMSTGDVESMDTASADNNSVHCVAGTKVSSVQALDSSASCQNKPETAANLQTSTSTNMPETSNISLPQTSKTVTSTPTEKSSSSTADKIVSSAAEAVSGEDKEKEVLTEHVESMDNADNNNSVPQAAEIGELSKATSSNMDSTTQQQSDSASLPVPMEED